MRYTVKSVSKRNSAGAAVHKINEKQKKRKKQHPRNVILFHHKHVVKIRQKGKERRTDLPYYMILTTQQRVRKH